MHVFDKEIQYEAQATSGRQRRLIEQIRTLYRENDLTGLLDLGHSFSRSPFPARATSWPSPPG